MKTKNNLTYLVCFFVVLSCFLNFTVSEAASPGKKSIRLGLLVPYTGIYASLGRDLTNGIKLYLKQIGGEVNGHEIVLITKDSKGDPATGLTKTRELVENDNAEILTGYVHSGVILAARDYVHTNKIPMVVICGSARAVTQDRKSPHIFRTIRAGGQQERAAGWYLATKTGIKRAITVYPDYVMGYEGEDGFKTLFTKYGGKIVDSILPAIATADYGPFLGKIADKAKEADAVVCGFSGADGVKFVNQFAAFGLREKIPIWGWSDMVDYSLLPAEGDNAMGFNFYSDWDLTLDLPENRKFVESFRKEYQVDPGIFNQHGYVGAKAICMALEKVGGDLSNMERFLEALRAVKFPSTRGAFYFDKDQNPVNDVYIGKVEKVDGKIVRRIYDVVRNVDQHWMGPK